MSTKDERGEVAWAAFQQLVKSLEAARLELEDPNLLETALLAMLNQHGAHITRHIQEQSNVDPCKIVCWAGCSLLKEVCLIKDAEGRCPAHAVADATIRTLEGFLYEDQGVCLSEKSHLLLLRMLIQEKQDNYKQSEHGIWQNGLYATFHVASEVAKSLRSI